MSTLGHMGVSGNLWLLYSCLGMQSKVKTSNLLLYPFEERQCVRQGCIPSNKLFRGGPGAVSPTCADDITLLADTTIGLQRLLGIAESDASWEPYQYNKTKTNIMMFIRLNGVHPCVGITLLQMFALRFHGGASPIHPDRSSTIYYTNRR